MAANPQSRKWMLTINNPQDCGLDHSGMQRLLSLFCLDYFCLADEIATTGTFHTHIFIYSKSPIRFSTLKKRFRQRILKKHLEVQRIIVIISVRKANGSMIKKLKLPLRVAFMSLV